MRIMQRLQVMAVRNGKSKVPAARKVSELLTKKISNLYGEQQVKSKGYAEAIWKQLQSSALTWARKKSRVELLQVSSVTGQVHESDEAVYVQQPRPAIVVDAQDDVATDVVAGPDVVRGKVLGDEAWWLNCFQRALVVEKKFRPSGAHISQLVYMFRQMRPRACVQQRAECSEALLVCYADEPSNESSCVPDVFVETWSQRARAFLSLVAIRSGLPPNHGGLKLGS